MSQPTAAKELSEDEQAATRRRSTRIAAAVTARRASATEEADRPDTPVRATRGKRPSVSQDDEDVAVEPPGSARRLSTSRSKAGTRSASKSPSALPKVAELKGTPLKRTRSRGSMSNLDDVNIEKGADSPATSRRKSIRSMSSSPTFDTKVAVPARAVSASPTPEAVKTPSKFRGRRTSVTEKVIPLEAIKEAESKTETSEVETKQSKEKKQVDDNEAGDENVLSKKKAAVSKKQSLQTISEKTPVKEEPQADKISNDANKQDAAKLMVFLKKSDKIDEAVLNKTPEMKEKKGEISLSLLKSKSPEESKEEKDLKTVLAINVEKETPKKDSKKSSAGDITKSPLKTKANDAEIVNITKTAVSPNEKEKRLVVSVERNLNISSSSDSSNKENHASVEPKDEESPKKSLVVELEPLNVDKSPIIVQKTKMSEVPIKPNRESLCEAMEVEDFPSDYDFAGQINKQKEPSEDLSESPQPSKTLPPSAPKISAIEKENPVPESNAETVTVAKVEIKTPDSTPSKAVVLDADKLSSPRRRSARLLNLSKDEQDKETSPTSNSKRRKSNSSSSSILDGSFDESAINKDEQICENEIQSETNDSKTTLKENGIELESSISSKISSEEMEDTNVSSAVPNAEVTKDVSSEESELEVVDISETNLNINKSKSDENNTEKNALPVVPKEQEKSPVKNSVSEVVNGKESNRVEIEKLPIAKDSAMETPQKEDKVIDNLPLSKKKLGDVSQNTECNKQQSETFSQKSNDTSEMDTGENAPTIEPTLNESKENKTTKENESKRVSVDKEQNENSKNNTVNEDENNLNESDHLEVTSSNKKERSENVENDNRKENLSIDNLNDSMHLENATDLKNTSLTDEDDLENTVDVENTSENTSKGVEDLKSANLNDSTKKSTPKDSSTVETTKHKSKSSSIDAGGNDSDNLEILNTNKNKSELNMSTDSKKNKKSDKQLKRKSDSFSKVQERENTSNASTPLKKVKHAKPQMKSKLAESSSNSEKEESDLETKIDDLIAKHKNKSESDSEDESIIHFLDDMAEEGDEDTPSDGSNDIIDEGESVGSSSSEEDDSDDTYDKNDSFLDDDESHELLSGEEYDLGNEKKSPKKKRTRIIKISDSEEDGKVPQKKSALKKESTNVVTKINQAKDKLEKLKNGVEEESDFENMSVQPYCGLTPPSVVSMRDSLSDNEKIEIKDDEDDDNSSSILINKEDNLKSLEKLNTEKETLEPNTDTSPKSPKIVKEIEADTSNSSVIESETTHKSEVPRKRNSSITIQESITLKDVQEGNITEHISKVMDMFCSTIKTKGKDYSNNVSLNISLELLESRSVSPAEQVHVGMENKKETLEPSQITTSKEAKTEKTTLKKKPSTEQNNELIEAKMSESFSKKQKKKKSPKVQHDVEKVLLVEEQDLKTNENEKEKPDLKKQKKKKSNKILLEQEIEGITEETEVKEVKVSKKQKKKRPQEVEQIVSEQDIEDYENDGKDHHRPMVSLIKEKSKKRKQAVPLDIEVPVEKRKKQKKAKTKSVESDDMSEDLDAELYEKYSSSSADDTTFTLTKEMSSDVVKKSKKVKKFKTKTDFEKETELVSDKIDVDDCKLVKKVKKRRHKNLEVAEDAVVKKDKKQDIKIKSPLIEEFIKKSKKPKVKASTDSDLLSDDVFLENDEEPLKKKKKQEKHKEPASSNVFPKSKDLKYQYFPSKILQTWSGNKKAKSVKKPSLLPSTSIGQKSWEVVEVNSPLCPSSTCEITKKEKQKFDTGRFHEKDFKNRMLFDPARAPRMDTRVLLKKKQKMKF